MPLSKDEIKNILSFLEEKYPATFDSVDSLKKAAPPQVNSNELFRNLYFCWEEHFINATPIKEDARGVVDFYGIQINSTGIRFLRNF
jgi:hypothetical protein